MSAPPNRRHSNRACSHSRNAGVAGFFSTLVGMVVLTVPTFVDAAAAGKSFEKDIQPLLAHYCYDCHGDGAAKGKVAFDGFGSVDELMAQRNLWQAVLRNTRAGLMPPEKKPRPSPVEQQMLEGWIKHDVFKLDPMKPDPGRVTLRRLNRVEYQNTIRDLMGYDFKAEEELPPDDTGYGFDNNGDVLTVSPMLLEKYMQAAERIVTAAVPRVPWVMASRTVLGSEARGRDRGKGGDKTGGDKFSVYESAKLSRRFMAEHAGSYQLQLEIEMSGQFAFDPGRCRVVLKVDDRELWHKEFGWENGQKSSFDFDQKWPEGERKLELELQPLTPLAKKTNSLDLRILALRVKGPSEPRFYIRPANYDLFFFQDVPTTASQRSRYAREILSRFATKAFRRPVDESSLERLVKIAERASREKGARFEDGVARAMVPVLASPRFLFHVEGTDAASLAAEAVAKLNTPQNKAATRPDLEDPLVDEFAFASRLSYFLWSTMPDGELLRLAAEGSLRKNLGAQVTRMLAHAHVQELTANFVGQWLQVRDIDGIDINARVVLARDSGQERGSQADRRRQELRDIPDEKLTIEQKAELEELRAQFRRRNGNKPPVELDRDLRRALRQETELCFSHVVREDRSVLELLNGDYTFLNEKLARHYGITNVTGPEMRRVMLAADSPRGGVLTHGAALIVTSNPTRTSPVKRGLFILDNILGIPTPPPPPDIPNLEDSEKESAGHPPTLRETLAIHREKPLCASCHNRMDPIGL
ncbi:MAG: hypothetical protein QOF48_3960, partial [Verrucomicrobiota bacterium]